jgi:hypothetical protein
MKSIITQIPYEFKYPGFVCSSICLENNITNVFYFVQSKDQVVDMSYAQNAHYSPLFTNYDYSKFGSIEEINIPSHILASLSHYKSFILSHINRWHKNYSIKSNYLSYEVLYYRLVTYWYNFLIKNNVVAFFTWMPHAVDDSIIYSLCKTLKIKVTNESDFKILGQSRQVVTLNLSEFIIENVASIKNLESDLDEYRSRFLPDIVINPLKAKLFAPNVTNRFNYISYLLKRVSYHIRTKNYNVLLMKSKYLIMMRFKEMGVFKYIKSIEKDSSYVIGLRFVYFPLHLQPEATTSLYGGVYENQLFAVKTISSKLEPNTYLVIKEHPAYWLKKGSEYFHGINEYRSKAFYESILQLDNVILVDHNTSSDFLIDNSLGVATINGSVTLESLERGKYVLLFGDYFYKYLPNVIHYQTEEDVLRFISLFQKYKISFPYKIVEKQLKLIQLNSYIYQDNIIESDRDYIVDLYKKLFNHN